MQQPLPYTSIISIKFTGLFMLPPVKVKDMDGHGTCQATTLLLWLPPVGGKKFGILVKLSHSMTASGFKFANISGNTSRRFHSKVFVIDIIFITTPPLRRVVICRNEGRWHFFTRFHIFLCPGKAPSVSKVLAAPRRRWQQQPCALMKVEARSSGETIP